MFANVWMLPTLALTGAFYALGRRLAALGLGPARRRLVAVLSLALCLPAASFVLYYMHVVREPAWYVDWRSRTAMELLSALWALPAGFLEPGEALARHLPAVRTLLGRRPGLRLGLLLAILPFLKPVVFPVAWGNRFAEAWSDGVCMQSTMATCGPCSLATVLRSLGLEATEEAIARGAYTSATGTESWYLLRYARARGLKARVLDGVTLAEVAPPAILGVKTGGAGHFVVYLGQDRGAVVIGDPLSGRGLVPERDFARYVDFTGFAMEFSR